MADVELYEPFDVEDKENEKQPGCCACLPVAQWKRRDAFWDNCKGLGQLFVISMHMTAGLNLFSDWKHRGIQDKLADGYMMVILLFTMPGYSFISGMFSSTTLSNKRVLDHVKFMAAFLINHFLSMAIILPDFHKKEVNVWKHEHPKWKSRGLAPPAWLPVQFFENAGVDWFLFSVVVWRAFVPIMARLKWPITTSLLFAMLVMMTDATNNTYINAVCLFLPFFMLGFTFGGRSDELKRRRNNMVLRTAFIVVTALLVFSPFVDTRPHDAILLGLGCIYGGRLRDSMHLIATSNTTELVDLNNATKLMTDPWLAPHSDYCQTALGFVNTLSFYVLSVFMIFGFATIVPDRPVWLMTKAGVNSLYIYLCHFWFAIVPSYFGCMALAASGYGPYPQVEGVLVLVGTSLFFCWCLAGEWLKKTCFLCVEPPCGSLLLEPEETSADSESSHLSSARSVVLLGNHGNQGLKGSQSVGHCDEVHVSVLEEQTQKS